MGRSRPEGAPELAGLSRFKGVVGRGWSRQLPGGRPLATPAVVGGSLLVRTQSKLYRLSRGAR